MPVTDTETTISAADAPSGNWVNHLPEPALLVDASLDTVLAVNTAMAKLLGSSRGAQRLPLVNLKVDG